MTTLQNTTSPLRGATARRSTAFLTELLIVILFFSVASAVTIRMFAAAHDTSAQSERLHSAVIEAQSVAEVLRVEKDATAALAFLYGNVTQQDELFVVQFDKSWQPVSSEGAYVLSVAQEDIAQAGGDMLTFEIHIATAQGETIYRLETGSYTPQAGGASDA